MIKAVVNPKADRGEWRPWKKNPDGSLIRYRVRIIPPSEEKKIFADGTRGLTQDKLDNLPLADRTLTFEKLMLFRGQYAVTEIDGLSIDLKGPGVEEGEAAEYAKSNFPEGHYENFVVTIKEGPLSDTTKANICGICSELFIAALKESNELRGVATLGEVELGKT